MQFNIRSNWDTQHLSVRNTAKKDIPYLQEILRVLHVDSNWEKVSLETYNKFYFENLFSKPSLPPGGNSKSIQNQTIVDKSNNTVIGWFEFYHGYPSNDIFWIGSLFLHPEKKGRGYGKEVVTELINQLKVKPYYRSIQLGVYLRNWSALNFWFHMGFNKIIKFAGDREFSESKNGKMCLEMQL